MGKFKKVPDPLRIKALKHHPPSTQELTSCYNFIAYLLGLFIYLKDMDYLWRT